MASSYAIPVSPPLGNYYYHQHSHSYSPSYSSIQLSPKRERTNSTSASSRGSGYGHNVRKAGSNGSLYTHAEVSPERGPVPPPLPDLNPEIPPTPQQRAPAFQTNGYVLEPPNTHTRHSSSSSMKSRPRGESDLGRPQSVHHAVPRATTTATTSIPSAPRLSMPEALTSLLIPLPFFFASAAFYTPPPSQSESSPVSAFAKLQHSVLDENGIAHHARVRVGSAWIDTCIITSGTLLLVGCLAKMRASRRGLDQRKDKPGQPSTLRGMASVSALRAATVRALSVGLPFYASAHIGGARTGILLLVSHAASRTGQGRFLDVSSQSWRQVLDSRLSTLAVMVTAVVLDLWGTTSSAPTWDVFTGYLALACSMLVFPSPLPASFTPGGTMWSRIPSGTVQSSWNQFLPVSALVRTVDDIYLTIFAGAVMSVLTVFAAVCFPGSWNMTPQSAVLILLAIACSLNAVLLSRPASLHSRHKAGLGLGCGSGAIFSLFFPSSSGTGTFINCLMAALFYISVCIDTRAAATHKPHDHHDHDHAHGVHEHKLHQHSHPEGNHSAFTQMILNNCEPGSLVHDIVSEKDSRRIAYFTVLNFGFMLVQGAYGYMSGSLGLLSDTVHMGFDCLGLVVGLGAAVAAKWPTSPERPYGWGKLNTLAGFGNGIFLMLVSVEFVWEAVECMLERRELRHVQELLVVSTLGLLVNMVGLFAFGHAHAGHDHGHGHGHDHGHDHGHGHGHSHDNENMHGIFLHVAADAGGSLAVIVSTALTLWRPWYLWDPLATILIAVLIFAAAVPLVASSGQKLLLVVPTQLEYSIKDALQELGELRGVVGYTVPRFWVDERGSAEGEEELKGKVGDGGCGGHGHQHGHEHSHDHNHHDHHDHHRGEGHGCEHGHEHGHRHEHQHDYQHDHQHEHQHGHQHEHQHEHEHEHDHAHGGCHSSPAGRERVMGVIHVVAAQAANLEDVRKRVEDFARERNMDLVIQVEREGEGHESCWCSVGPKSG